MTLAPYRKAVAGFVTPLIGWAAAVVGSGESSITGIEWVGLAIVAASGLGVYSVANS